MVLAWTGVILAKPMLDVAWRIHSASGGVSASQAREGPSGLCALDWTAILECDQRRFKAVRLTVGYSSQKCRHVIWGKQPIRGRPKTKLSQCHVWLRLSWRRSTTTLNMSRTPKQAASLRPHPHRPERSHKCSSSLPSIALLLSPSIAAWCLFFSHPTSEGRSIHCLSLAAAYLTSRYSPDCRGIQVLHLHSIAIQHVCRTGNTLVLPVSSLTIIGSTAADFKGVAAESPRQEPISTPVGGDRPHGAAP